MEFVAIFQRSNGLCEIGILRGYTNFLKLSFDDAIAPVRSVSGVGKPTSPIMNSIQQLDTEGSYCVTGEVVGLVYCPRDDRMEEDQ